MQTVQRIVGYPGVTPTSSLTLIVTVRGAAGRAAVWVTFLCTGQELFYIQYLKAHREAGLNKGYTETEHNSSMHLRVAL